MPYCPALNDFKQAKSDNYRRRPCRSAPILHRGRRQTQRPLLASAVRSSHLKFHHTQATRFNTTTEISDLPLRMHFCFENAFPPREFALRDAPATTPWPAQTGRCKLTGNDKHPESYTGRAGIPRTRESQNAPSPTWNPHGEPHTTWQW